MADWEKGEQRRVWSSLHTILWGETRGAIAFVMRDECVVICNVQVRYDVAFSLGSEAKRGRLRWVRKFCSGL